MLKKVGIVVGVVIGLFLVAAIVVPMVYDVNTKVKPLIIQAVEENLNAKAEIGQLKLSLWGGLNVAVESLKIRETVMNTTVFEMKNAKLEVPFSAIFGGHLNVTLVADGPMFNVQRDKTGQMNVMKMMKPSAQKKEEKAAASGGMPSGATDIASRVSVSTKITNAKLTFKDEMTSSSSTIDKLGLDLSNIGINTPVKMKVTADLAVTQGKDISLKGPMSFDGTAKIAMKPEGFDKMDFQAMLDLDGLEIRYSTLFDKGSKVPLRVETKLVATSQSLVIDQLDLIANDLKINNVISVTNFDAPVLDVKVTSNQMKLENWKGIIGPLKTFDMSGGASLKFAAKGPTSKLEYSGTVELKDASLQSPGIVPRVENVNAKLDIVTDMVKLESFAMKMGASDLAGSGTVKNFAAPNIDFKIRSKMMNIDELIGMKFDQKAPEPTKAGKELTDAEMDKQMESMAKGPIAAIKGNPILRNLVFKSNTHFEKMVVHKAPLSDFDADVDFEKLTMSLKQAKLKAFSGSADAHMSVDFNAAEPAYKVGGAVKGVDLDAAMTSQFADLKGFITGRANSTMEISGSGVAITKVKQNLRGGGKFDVVDGTWSGLSALKMVADKAKSIPQLQGKLAGINVGNKFKSLTGQFDIKDARLNLSKVNMDLEEAKTGITADGYVGFDKVMHIAGNLVAPIKDAPKKLLGPDGRARIPYEINGPLLSPSPNADATLKPLASAYLEHEGKKAASQAIQKGVDELKKNDKLKGLIKDNQVKDALKGLGL